MLYASFLGVVLVFSGCALTGNMPPIEQGTADPGGTVARKGQPLTLMGEPVAVGAPLPVSHLVDASSMELVDLSQERGKVLLLSIVPSIDTKVCEAQTHYLGEKGDHLPDTIRRITISRDTPFAQQRFAAEAKLDDLQYLSDYREGDFGAATGLMIDELRLLARSIIVVDKDGVVRYIQVVPEITHLPDMERAFSIAEKLAQ
jgi:thiol peroxidase